MIDGARLLALMAAVAAGSFGLTGLVRRYARIRLLDVPNARSSHSCPTPRGGGAAVVVAWLIALWLAPVSAGSRLALAFSGGLAVAAVGFVDDHRPLSARHRMAVHLGAAIWALGWLGGLPQLALGGHSWALGWAGSVLGVVTVVWMLNLFNFMDGIDGLAGSEAVFVAGAAGLLGQLWYPDSGLGPLNLLLAASCLGFLAWNWPPASIFMGDVGSGFIGFVLGVSAIASARLGGLSLGVWLILSAVFVADASYTLLWRVASGQRWFEAHRSHGYQHAVARLGGHRPVTLAVWAINLGWLLPLALLAVARPDYEWLCLLMAYAPLLLFAVFLGAGRSQSRRVGEPA